MRWQQTEFILKGAYLGLLVLVGMQAPDWAQAAQVALITVGGLIVALGFIAVRMLRDGYRVRGRFAGFILFLILENPVLVYTGLIAGLAVGTYSILKQNDAGVLAPVLGGAALGYVFWLLRHVQDRRITQWVGLALAVVLAGGAIAFLIFEPIRLTAQQRDMIGSLLLLGIPGFYLLTFAGTVEESEIEIAAICAALGIGLWILGDDVSPTFKNMALLVPLTLYFVYTRRILPVCGYSSMSCAD